MESQFNQTNIAVLSPAFPPSKPASPNVPLNMLSAAVLGLFLGLVLAVVAEMLNPRVGGDQAAANAGRRRCRTDVPAVPRGRVPAPSAPCSSVKQKQCRR